MKRKVEAKQEQPVEVPGGYVAGKFLSDTAIAATCGIGRGIGWVGKQLFAFGKGVVRVEQPTTK